MLLTACVIPTLLHHRRCSYMLIYWFIACLSVCLLTWRAGMAADRLAWSSCATCVNINGTHSGCVARIVCLCTLAACPSYEYWIQRSFDS